MDFRKRQSPVLIGGREAGNIRGQMRSTGFGLALLCVVAVATFGVYYGSNSLEFLKVVDTATGSGRTTFSPNTNLESDNKFLDGLLSPEFPEQSCQSRYQSHSYRKRSPDHKPSSHLRRLLRQYEARHERCAPHTHLYNQTLDQFKYSNRTTTPTHCKYVIYNPQNGLGNRILGLTSTFLYALLTNRTLLVHLPDDMSDHFCEPFPKGSWILPADFQLWKFQTYISTSPVRYGNMLKNNKAILSTKNLPSNYVYIHLMHDYKNEDKMFYCDDGQDLLRNVSWMVLMSDSYFVPGLFMVSGFEEELSKMFPEKDVVFHHLGRYLLHPTNPVWGMITRFYDSYLRTEGETLGIQIRSFSNNATTFRHVLDQVLSCTWREKLLPELDLKTKGATTNAKINKPKVVFLTSLQTVYYDNITNMYWEHPTSTGEIVKIYQASHELFQQTKKVSHNMRAWAEIYLLSLCDVLVTSSWSTFGYVAQGLGGVRPWVLFREECYGADGIGGMWQWIKFRNKTVGDTICRRVASMEPCFHTPPMFDCRVRRAVDSQVLPPYVSHCEDMSWGLRLVGNPIVAKVNE